MRPYFLSFEHFVYIVDFHYKLIFISWQVFSLYVVILFTVVSIYLQKALSGKIIKIMYVCMYVYIWVCWNLKMTEKSFFILDCKINPRNGGNIKKSHSTLYHFDKAM